MKSIEDLIGKCKNRVHRVGIELEGGWEVLPKNVRALHQDVSVKIPNFAGHLGEIASAPLGITWPKWVRDHYPHINNETCGLHVHMSLRRQLHYMRLMTPAYTEVLVRSLFKWAGEQGIPHAHPLWNRLAGKNRFCSLDFYADAQVTNIGKTDNRRRTFVNYPYGLHSTVECRGLSMMPTVDLAVEAIQRVLDVTNAFLVLQARKEAATHAVALMDQEFQGDYQEFSSCV